MAISIQLGIQIQVTEFRGSLQGSLGLLSNTQSALGFESFGRISSKRRVFPCLRGSNLTICCQRGATSPAVEKDDLERQISDLSSKQLSIVMKFGGSSVATAERMRAVASLILSFPNETPVIVLSAMGKTTNQLLLAGEKAVICGVSNVSGIDELRFIKELHLKTVNELGIDRAVILGLLEELEQLLGGIAVLKEMTIRTRDYLMSFGECMSTKIFSKYLNKLGIKARQYDAYDIGFITTDRFSNADIIEETYPIVAKRLSEDWFCNREIPIITGFLGKGCKSSAVTTLGRGGSDLTATSIGKALGLREIQIWKNVDGILTCDPKIHTQAALVPYLTYEEAAELAYFGAQVFSIFDEWGISIDCLATSEDSITLALDSSKLWSRKLIQQELDHVVEELEKIAVVRLLQNRSIISLIGNAQRSSLVLEKAFHVLRKNGVNVQMLSQGAFKANISIVVHDNEAKECITALHSAFFENTNKSSLECSGHGGSYEPVPATN